MKKILFIHHASGWGGAPNCLLKIINSLDSSKFEAEVLLLKHSIVADKLDEYGIKYSIAKSRFYKEYYKFFPHSEAGYIKWFQVYTFLNLSVLWILSRYLFARKELNRHEFDIIHLNSSVLTDWLAPAKERGKVVMHIREPFRKGKLDILHYFFKSLISKYADQLIVISNDNASRIDIPAKTEVIFDHSEIPIYLPLESSYASKKVLYLGGSSSSKGFYTMVETLDYLNKDVKVYFLGLYVLEGKSDNIIERILRYIFSKERKRKSAIKKIINHPNAILKDVVYNVAEYLDEVCCLISPFTVSHFSNPVIEAQLHKKPSIGSDVVGMNEIIEHEINGLIVPKNNPIVLAAAINSLTANSDKAKTLGEAGYNKAIHQFTHKNVLKIELIYNRLLQANCKIKILYVHHTSSWGGPANSLIKLLSALDSSKYDTEVLLLKNSILADRFIENGIKYKVANSIFYKKYYDFFPHSEAGYVKWFQIYTFIRLSFLWGLSRYYFAKKELSRHDFDIIHLNSSVLTDWLAPGQKKGKVIIHIREPFRKGKFDFLHHLFKSIIRKYADQIIAISEDNSRRIAVPSKTSTIYNYSEIPKNVPSENSYSSKKVLYLGGSSTSKGFFTLVEAMDYINRDVIVYFAGHYTTDKDPRSILSYFKFLMSNAQNRKKALKKIDNYPNAILLGLTYEVDKYLNEVCCLISPFVNPHFSRPVIEAHLHKKPAIVSNVEGMEEIVEHDRSGLIVPKNNPKALANAINKITSESKMAKNFGEFGYNIAIHKFTQQNIIQVECLYDQFITG
ncbi:MAG: glycosyltransferase family 4 protein [Bacteroidales bacterium]